VWDQQSLVNSFITMALTPPAVTDWVTDSGASNHTTSDAGNLTSVRPPTFTNPSSIIISNGSALSITSVGDSALPGPFYLNNILITPDIIQKIYLFIALPLTIGVLWNLMILVQITREQLLWPDLLEGSSH
jgi:hypothetical protein